MISHSENIIFFLYRMELDKKCFQIINMIDPLYEKELLTLLNLHLMALRKESYFVVCVGNAIIFFFDLKNHIRALDHH